MRILLLGDLSGVHKNLQHGLINCGYTKTTLASSGDGFKNITSDIVLPKLVKFSKFNKIKYRLKYLNFLLGIRGYDIVQICDPFFLPFPFFPYKEILNYLKNNNGKIFLMAGGSDSFYWMKGIQKLKYNPYKEHIKYDLQGIPPKQESEKSFAFNKFIADNVNGIIPNSYEYHVAYSDHHNIRNLILQPIYLQEKSINKFSENKLAILHGISRYGLKGTIHIESAFKKLTQRYKKDIEFKITRNLKIDDYLNEIDKSDVIVDQCYSQSYGMNALYALSRNKIVLSGAEPEALKAMKVENCPVLNIQPNKKNICDVLSKLIANKNLRCELRDYSLTYLQKYHDSRIIAEKYIKEWKK